MTRSFGIPVEGANYKERVGAYAVVADDRGRVALVEAPSAGTQERRFFLIGGGIEPGESDAESIRRECMEETGHTITVGNALCVGDEYLFAPTDQCYLHVIGRCYRAVLGDKVGDPADRDHLLVWTSVDVCIDRLFLQYQRWAVKTAWEKEICAGGVPREGRGPGPDG